MKPRLISLAIYLFTAILAIALLQACQKDQVEPDSTSKQAKALKDVDFSKYLSEMNPIADMSNLPPSAIQRINYPKPSASAFSREPGCEEALTPTSLEATLKPEEAVTETKTACLDGAPPKGDVLFSMDLTGSMWDELATVKANSVNIMNALRVNLPDTWFGVISHMDYPASYNYCGYSNTYGSSSYGDYPYRLDQWITDETDAVETAINSLVLGNGMDFPECYARVFFETYSDRTIDWRDGAAKIVVAFLDAPPHDCDYGTGGDPGRDGIMDNEDDIAMADAIDGMIDNNIKLIVICSDYDLMPYWQSVAEQTGGTAVFLMGDEDVVELISGLVEETVSSIANLSLQPDNPDFNTWVATDPASYTGIMLDETHTYDFEVTITVPAGTPDGSYHFNLNLLGDGAVYGTQSVTITVLSEIEVAIDIHPEGCPNPMNTKSKGVLPVSICGTADFDVADIDVSTVRLAGVPVGWSSLGDDSTPYLPFVNKPLHELSCNESGPDGYIDLKLKFENQLVIKAIGPVQKEDVIRVILTGELYDGTKIIGEDIVKIVN
jgi:hypothetical protein